MRGSRRGHIIDLSAPTSLYPMKPMKRKLTASYIEEACIVIGDYQRWGRLTMQECADFKEKIQSAPHDDAIADIMRRARERVYA